MCSNPAFDKMESEDRRIEISNIIAIGEMMAYQLRKTKAPQKYLVDLIV
jgi:hypothetical protein